MVATVCHLQGSATWCYNLPQVPLLHGATLSATQVSQETSVGFRIKQWKNLPAPRGPGCECPRAPLINLPKYISISFFSMNCYLFCGPQGDHAFTNFSHGSARESAVKKGLNSQAKEASLQDESVTGRPVD